MGKVRKEQLTAGTGPGLLEADANGDLTVNDNYYTKDEVDDLLGGVNFDYFFTDTIDPVIGGYNEMVPSDTGEAESTVALAIPAADTLIKSFITEINEPEFTNLLEGIYDVHIHAAKTAGTQDVFIYGKFYKRASGGAETLLGTTENSPLLSGSNAEYDLHFSVPSDEILASDDRLVVKFYGTPSGAGTTPTATLYLEGSNDSRVEVKTDSGFLEEKFVVKNGLSGGQAIKGGKATTETASMSNNAIDNLGFIINADGSVSVLNTPNYDALVLNDNDFPNKAYVDKRDLNVSSLNSVVAATGITPINTIAKHIVIPVESSTATDTNITAIPQIAAPAFDGQRLTIIGTDNTKTVTFDDGDGLVTDNGLPFTVGANDTLNFIGLNSLWLETARKDN